MSKKNRNQNKKENKSVEIYLGNGLATILKEAKPLFETREGYGWECPLKNFVDEDITAVYEYNDELYAVTCDLFDTPFAELTSEIRNKVREEAMRWLREIHNIHIEIFVIKNYDKKICEYTYTIMDLNFPGSDDGIDCCNNYKTYDQASEAAVKYCAERLVW